MSQACVKHPMTFGDNLCSECGHRFCRECVVFPFGEKKPGLCITCALERGGVRKHPTDRPKLTRRAVRERIRANDKHRSQPEEPEETEEDSVEETSDPWIGEETPIDAIPGAWSETFS